MHEDYEKYQEILCVALISYEGKISNANFSKSSHTPGNLIPYIVSESVIFLFFFLNFTIFLLKFLEPNFQKLFGVRIVRLATNEDNHRMGYGTKTVVELEKLLLNVSKSDSLANDPEHEPLFLDSININNLPDIKYIGVSFGVTPELYVFWNRLNFMPVNLSNSKVIIFIAFFLKHFQNDLTGENSIIMLKDFSHRNDEHSDWLKSFNSSNFHCFIFIKKF